MSEFEYIAKDIISNPRVQSFKNEPHHGTTRYNHVMHVAKRTYKLSKKMHLDYVSATRGALLHDYFNDSEYTYYNENHLCINDIVCIELFENDINKNTL